MGSLESMIALEAPGERRGAMSDKFEAEASAIQLGDRASRIPGARSFLVARRGETLFVINVLVHPANYVE